MKMRVGAFELRKIGAYRYDLRDPYHIAVTVPWWLFFGGLVATFVGINLAFAALYLLAPGSVTNLHSPTDAFFFSIETLATVGYGAMAPASLYAHLISALEILSGMIFTALTTGLIFVRFSRPRARLLYAEHAVVAVHNGRPALMVRLGNVRASVLTNATARLAALMPERTLEGALYRRPRDLKLDRAHLPIFALTWTLIHLIDEDSPLYGYDTQKMELDQVRLFLSIAAHDEGLNADVQDMRDYGPDKIKFGHRYQDAVAFDPQGRTFADLGRVGLTEPDPHPLRPAQRQGAREPAKAG